LFFTANDGIHGRELWKSDGTKAGTELVKDIHPPSEHHSAPYSLTGVGGTLFFTADDGIHGRELWKSDGTKAGTVLVKDIRPPAPPGEYDSSPYSLTDVGGTLFFTADDGIHGWELWKSDGTKAGTVLVKDIHPGERDSRPNYLTAVGGTLFFTAVDGTHGRDLWKSDGTKAGTVLVKDFHPVYDYRYYTNPRSLTNVGGTLFFTADDSTHGVEVWKSDGTKAGTVLLKDILPGGGDGLPPYSLTDVRGTLFFTADDGAHDRELWKSDGTRAGTVLVKDINPVIDYYDVTGPRYLSGVGGTVFFNGDDSTHGRELWKSDGTRAGTVLVKDIHPADSHFVQRGPYSLTDVRGTLFFTANDGAHGRELWKSDGTRAGTVLVKDINPVNDYYGSGPSNLTGLGRRLFFSADDGIHGSELWKSDGTRAGTVLVKDINVSGCKVATNGPADPARAL
jgi:ELWxxDGT repeat protein